MCQSLKSTKYKIYVYIYQLTAIKIVIFAEVTQLVNLKLETTIKKKKKKKIDTCHKNSCFSSNIFVIFLLTVQQISKEIAGAIIEKEKTKNRKLSEVILMPHQNVQTDYFYDPIFTIFRSARFARIYYPGILQIEERAITRVVLGHPQSPFSCTRAVQ